MITMSGFLLSVGKFFGSFFAKKALDSAINYKSNKKDREQILDIQSVVRENNTILKGLINESSELIRNAVSELTPLIETLHVVTAHEVLSNLREKVKAEDRKTLSRIDYYRGCCSRYINKNQCINEFNLACQEMIDGGVYDPEIVAGRIYVHCLEKDKNAAILAANKLKEVCRANIWAWVPELLFADNLMCACESLPQDIDKHLVLANSCMFGNNKESLGVDINTYKVVFPDNLTYDNIPLWAFNISVLINRFMPEWISNAQKGVSQDNAKALFDATNRLKELEKRTQLNSTFGDLDFWNAISGCQINPTKELMEALRTSKCQKEFEEYRVIAYVVCLANQNESTEEEAKTYLESCVVTPATLNQRFLLSLKTMDAAYAEESFRIAAQSAVIFPAQLIMYALSAIKNFKNQVREYAPQIKVEGELESRAYEQICHFFFDEETDIEFILENKDNVSPPFRPFLAIVLHESNHIEEGTALMRSVLPDKSVDMISCMYADLLASNRCHTEEYYNFLRYVRKDLGYTENPIWLQNEYSIASRLPDSESMVETSGILHKRYPERKDFYLAYLSSLTSIGKSDELIELVQELEKYELTPDDAIYVFRQLMVGNQIEPAAEFLYRQVIQNPTHEGLNMEFHRASIAAVTARIIHQEYDEVFDGAYVQYKVNGNDKSTIVDAANRDGFLIGMKKGDTMEQKDWRNNPEIYEVVSIHNKYHQLVERIYKDIGDNKFKSVRSFQFTDEEIHGGNIFSLLESMTGHDAGWYNQRRETERKYKDGEYPLSVFLGEESLLDDIYNHLFGDFKVYFYPKNFFEIVFEREGVSISELQPVFDLPTVILAFELHLKFNLNVGKFLVPESLVKVIENSVKGEIFGLPRGVYQMVADLLTPIDSSENKSWTDTRFNAILSWIRENAETIQVTARLNQEHDELFKESSYFTVFYDCLSLITEKRVLISADKALTKLFLYRAPITDFNYLSSVLFPEQYKSICQFLIQANIFGGELDADYILSEFTKHCVGECSTFNNCKENLIYNKALFNVVVKVCEQILETPVASSADGLVVDSLLSEIFKSHDRDTAHLLLLTCLSQTQSILLKKSIVDAYKTVFPLN